MWVQDVGGAEKYTALCRQCFRKADTGLKKATTDSSTLLSKRYGSCKAVYAMTNHYVPESSQFDECLCSCVALEPIYSVRWELSIRKGLCLSQQQMLHDVGHFNVWSTD